MPKGTCSAQALFEQFEQFEQFEHVAYWLRAVKVRKHGEL
jgi:hypothetical protein